MDIPDNWRPFASRSLRYIFKRERDHSKNCENLPFAGDLQGFPGGANGKESTHQCSSNKRHSFNPWVRKSAGVGNGSSLQYSCLENSMDRGAWQAIVHGAAKSWTQLRARACTHTHTHEYLVAQLTIRKPLVSKRY